MTSSAILPICLLLVTYHYVIQFLSRQLLPAGIGYPLRLPTGKVLTHDVTIYEYVTRAHLTRVLLGTRTGSTLPPAPFTAISKPVRHVSR